MRAQQPTGTSLVEQALSDIDRLPLANTPAVRAVRRRLSATLRDESPKSVLMVARSLIAAGWRWVGYEVIHEHPTTLASLRLRDVEALGRGIDSWGAVDAFGIYIAGPAWLRRQIADVDVLRWTQSADRWWRRSALVATVVLNLKSRGGTGDADRTLRIATSLLDDRDPMIVKALSWALRALAARDPDATQEFLDRYDDRLASLVRRETRHKLKTGKKRSARGDQS